MTARKIGVLLGGLSSEREVSLNSGKNILAALRERGLDAVPIDWCAGSELGTLLRDARVAVVWNALHGTWGEDGAVQGLLECLQIPYTGSDVLASALAMDKLQSKRVFQVTGIPTPEWVVVGPADDGETAAAALGYPVVVKPSREGSSVGVSIVHGPDELAPAVALARRWHGPVLLERFVPGAELGVGILEDGVLGTVEIRPKVEFYDYEAKYLRDDTEYLVPAPLAPAVDAEVRRLGLAAHLALGCSGYSRVDLLLDADGKPYVLEVNTLPGMTDHSLLPKIARHAGMSYADLVVRILRAASLRE